MTVTRLNSLIRCDFVIIGCPTVDPLKRSETTALKSKVSRLSTVNFRHYLKFKKRLAYRKFCLSYNDQWYLTMGFPDFDKYIRKSDGKLCSIQKKGVFIFIFCYSFWRVYGNVWDNSVSKSLPAVGGLFNNVSFFFFSFFLFFLMFKVHFKIKIIISNEFTLRIIKTQLARFRTGDAQTHEHFRGQFCSSNKFQIYPNITKKKK